ncbi:MAG: hypothetical protein MJZ64_07565 [Paludibacteraceae bacterium]|nr:hypothetical protein [Paludibacteraceae bacterium]
MEYITKDIDELQNMIDEARHDGCTNVNIGFEPSMYNLVDEDDRPELENIDTDNLREELKRRTKEEYAEIECSTTDIAQNVIEKSPAAAREFFTDILGLTHLASVDEICNAIKERL